MPALKSHVAAAAPAATSAPEKTGVSLLGS
jgi:hypothetical protein